MSKGTVPPDSENWPNYSGGSMWTNPGDGGRLSDINRATGPAAYAGQDPTQTAPPGMVGSHEIGYVPNGPSTVKRK
jgi:hypothetical protein